MYSNQCTHDTINKILQHACSVVVRQANVLVRRAQSTSGALYIKFCKDLFVIAILIKTIA